MRFHRETTLSPPIRRGRARRSARIGKPQTPRAPEVGYFPAERQGLGNPATLASGFQAEGRPRGVAAGRRGDGGNRDGPVTSPTTKPDAVYRWRPPGHLTSDTAQRAFRQNNGDRPDGQPECWQWYPSDCVSLGLCVLVSRLGQRGGTVHPTRKIAGDRGPKAAAGWCALPWGGDVRQAAPDLPAPPDGAS